MKILAKFKIDATKRNVSNKLINVKNIIADDEKKYKRNIFIDKFILCEIACKHIVKAYKRQQKSLKPGSYITLDMRHIPTAMSTYEYLIPRHILSEVFSGNNQYGKRGSKSCKKLRDGIMHAMSENDLNEIIVREGQLHRSMDTFLSYFSESGIKNSSI